MHILVTVPVNDKQKEKLLAAAPDRIFEFAGKMEVTAEQLEDADIVLGNIREPSMLHLSKNLRWTHLGFAGADAYCKPGILPEGVQLANATGAYGPLISEHMVGMVFALRKEFDRYIRNQEKHIWQMLDQAPMIEGSTVLVIGLGDIGRHFAMKMKALGCYVIGIKRTVSEKPDYVDELYTLDKLDEVIGRADTIGMSLPGTPETRHIVNADRISKMKPNAIVINVGRGVSIDTEAITEALYEHQIAGAALDVFETEPLPSEHRLWDAPNMILTPHIAGPTLQPDTLDRIVSMFAENLIRDRKGEKLKYLVDLKTGYQMN